MLSIIVIGRNAAKTLSDCLSRLVSIKDEVKQAIEIIYVDSESDDDSIEIARSFNVIRLIKLTGDVNAAIARNVGAEHAKFKTLGFVDSDMELELSFVQQIFKSSGDLVYPFISGNWLNKHDDSNDLFIVEKKQFELEQDCFSSVTGGLFFISRNWWIELEGMDVRFKKGQDLDFGLRMAKRGRKLWRLNGLAAVHHTVSYTHRSRLWQEITNNLYARSLLYRKHVFNRHLYPYLIRQDYTLVILLISFFLWMSSGYLVLIVPILFYLIRSGLRPRLSFFYLTRDVLVLGGIFCFWPKRKMNTKVAVDEQK